MATRLSKPMSLLLILVTSTNFVTSMPAAQVFARQDVCAANNLLSCAQDLPDNFCCPEGSKCISLAGATSALCCPEGKDCKKIKPIICDPSAQDAAKFPGAPIKTTVFDVELKKCGSEGSCCPFGYSCAGEQCVRDEDQSEPPKGDENQRSSTTAPTSTRTTAPSSTSGTSSDVTSAPADAATPDSSSSSGASGPPTTAIIGGVVGGCVFLFLVAIIVFVCVRRRNKREATMSEKPRDGNGRGHSRVRSSGPFAVIISDPILQPNCVRTDFILKDPSVRSSGDSSGDRNSWGRTRTPVGGPAPGQQRLDIPRISIPNPFDSPNPSEHSPIGSRASVLSQEDDDHPLRTGHVGARLAPIRAMKASYRSRSRCLTPPVNVQGNRSSESINIFADPGTVGKNRRDNDKRLTRATTFTDLMDQAELGDVHRGRPFVPGSTPRI